MFQKELTSRLLGQSQTQSIEGLSSSNNSTWVRDGNELILTDDTQSSTYQIIELTENSLVITANSIEGLLETGDNSTTVIELKITFTR